jgi:4-oxalocrotonate tautomerase
MPLVTIKLVQGRGQDQKDELARRITDVMAEVGSLRPESIWVVFEEVPSEDWYVGGGSIAARRQASS